jgi:hypothetical protein
MRLKPAIALHEHQEDAVSGFGDREKRLARREARRARKQQRKAVRLERKGDRRLVRVQRKKQKVQRKLGPAQTLQPAPTTMPPPRKLLERAVDWVEELVDEGEEPLEEDEPFEEEDATEGIGAQEAWGPAVQMGRRLRIQAALGYRAAVIELKPGLFLVAEMPEALTRTEFGLAPLLAPMMMTAARRSMDEPRERRGPFSRLFQRRQREEPVRYVQVVQPVPALPGPVEQGVVTVVAPNVGWADDATVAAAYGCDRCTDKERR